MFTVGRDVYLQFIMQVTRFSNFLLVAKPIRESVYVLIDESDGALCFGRRDVSVYLQYVVREFYCVNFTDFLLYCFT